MPKCPDLKELRRAARAVAVELRAGNAEVLPADYLAEFHRRFDPVMTPEQISYCVDQQIWRLGKAAMKTFENEAQRRTDPAQLPLPMSMGDLRIPLSLPLERDGGTVMVTTRDARLQDCREYVRSLQENMRHCMKKLTEFLQMFREIEPLLVDHPDWTVGDALAFLRDQEQGAA